MAVLFSEAVPTSEALKPAFYTKENPSNLLSLHRPMTLKTIVLDADGVMVDYRAAFPGVYRKAFGKEITLVRPDAYFATNAYGLPRLETGTPEGDKFFSHFGDEDWAALPALPGAVEACHLLHGAGYRLVCVTSMPSRFVEARRRNFETLGLPLSGMVATGRHGQGNPKLEAIHDLQPVAFVDNLATNFEGLSAGVHTALIEYGDYDSPNRLLDLSEVDTAHASLLAFAHWWLEHKH